ncbi:DEKNAAC104735 [Brettanomyces naardenensis]|uniref:Mediator of RNA polymerase II transcription subunit 5 n=1 Tax=Brettanomyces naardenensis TaxID=13370 RepID=A0A448YRQ4_BRENA|nr:DEKNAAC104735 [Brettanomyces naardenensis]
MSANDAEPTLDKLVHISLKKRFHPMTFGKLFKEFKHKKLSTSPHESKIDMSALFHNCSRSPLQLKYIFEVLVTDDLNNSFEDLIDFFTKYLSQQDKIDQTAVMIYFSQISDEFPWGRLASSGAFLGAFGTYLKSFSNSHTSANNDSKMALMISKFIVNLLSSDTKVPESFNQDFVAFLDFLREAQFGASYEYLSGFFNQYNLTTVRKDYQSLTLSVNGPQGSLGTTKLLKLKKILWLSQQVTVKFTPINDKFIRAFKRLLNLSRVATAATNTSIAYELTVSLFDCLFLSTSKTHHIWAHAICHKLPQALKRLKISQAKLSNTLSNSFEAIGIDQNKSLITSLLKNLVSMKLVKVEQFSKLFPDPSAITPANSSRSLEELNHAYTSIFHTNNPEFVSMEESGVAEFIKSVSESTSQTEMFAKLVFESIDTLIANHDSTRLRRLLISLTLNREILDYVLLQGSPYNMARLLIAYLEEEIETKPDSEGKRNQFLQDNNADFMDLDLAEDDSSNAQDFFTDFGTVLIFIQFIVFRFNMNLWKFEKDKQALQLLNNASTVNSNNYLEKVQDPDSELNSIINDWIGSLFDNINTDGISDDLVKRCSLKDYHFIMPRVIEEAVSAFSLSLIDEDSLMGGLEYFYQPFLINNLTSIFRYLVNASWSRENQNDIITVTKILRKLSVADEMSGEVKLLHSMIMEIVNDDLYVALKNLNSLPQVEEYLSKLKAPDEAEVDLGALVSYVNDGVPAKFEIVMVYSIADSIGSQLDWFYDQLTLLLRTGSQKDETGSRGNKEFAEVLDYELIASLMIYYSSYQTCTNLKSWIANLNSFAEEKDGNVIFNRKAPKAITVVDSASERRNIEADKQEQKEAGNASESGDLSFDSSFFGFIQEPKSEGSPKVKEDPNAMDVDTGNVTGDTEEPQNNGVDEEENTNSGKSNNDLFIANLLVLIHYNDARTVNNLVTRILSNLGCLY